MTSNRAGRTASFASYGLLATCVLFMIGCQSAPTVDLEPDPLHIIEVTDATPIERAPLEIGADEDVVWLNASEVDVMKVEVLGFFTEETLEASNPAAPCFEAHDNRATTREVLAPGDAACLRFPMPGVYRYSVNGPDQPIQGQIIVRQEG